MNSEKNDLLLISRLHASASLSSLFHVSFAKEEIFLSDESYLSSILVSTSACQLYCYLLSYYIVQHLSVTDGIHSKIRVVILHSLQILIFT